MLTWDSLPRELLLKIFSYLDLQNIVAVSGVNKNWYQASRDDFLWRDRFIADFGISNISSESCHCGGHDVAASGLGNVWRCKYENFAVSVPRYETDHLVGFHDDQVLHVAFSNNGRLFSTCSKDGHVILWNARHPVTVAHRENMTAYSWKYTQFSEFNSDDSLLLVSGVLVGYQMVAGEIAVFAVDRRRLTLCCRISNKPYDLFGAWFSRHYVLSGEFRLLNNHMSVSQLWLNKAHQESHSEHISVVQRVVRFFNNPMHAHCRILRVAHWPHARRQAATAHAIDMNTAPAAAEDVPLPDRSAVADDDEDLAAPTDCQLSCSSSSSTICSSDSSSGESCDDDDDIDAAATAAADDAAAADEDVAEDDALAVTDDKYDGSDTTGSLLVFTCGTRAFVPHQVGFKRLDGLKIRTVIEPGPSLRERVQWLQARAAVGLNRHEHADAEEAELPAVAAAAAGIHEEHNDADGGNILEQQQQFFDEPDQRIDMHGQIIGLCLSRCHRYLYVNTRAWPSTCAPSSDILAALTPPPPIAQEIEIRVIDLHSMSVLPQVYRSHRAYTASDECFFLFLDVDERFVASGAEDCRAYLWHRCSGICLATYSHGDVVNATALAPNSRRRRRHGHSSQNRPPYSYDDGGGGCGGVLVTVSDDATVKVWRSWRHCRRAGIDLTTVTKQADWRGHSVSQSGHTSLDRYRARQCRSIER